MDLARTIAQLKTHCPELKKQVAGAAMFAAAQAGGFKIVPHAYVIPAADDAEPSSDQVGLTQEVLESFSVVLVLDNTPDRRGQAATLSVHDWKYRVHKALLNWRVDPDRASQGLQYEGSTLGDIDGARLLWTMTYSHTITLTDADGFQEQGEPLVVIDGTDHENRQTLRVDLPQEA